MYANSSNAKYKLQIGITDAEATFFIFLKCAQKLYESSFPLVLDSNFRAFPEDFKYMFGAKAGHGYLFCLCSVVCAHMKGKGRTDG